MFTVSETEAASIRDAFERDGEFRRLFPGITETAEARYWARVIAGWKPRPVAPAKQVWTATELEHMNGVWTG